MARKGNQGVLEWRCVWGWGPHSNWFQCKTGFPNEVIYSEINITWVWEDDSKQSKKGNDKPISTHEERELTFLRENHSLASKSLHQQAAYTSLNKNAKDKQYLAHYIYETYRQNFCSLWSFSRTLLTTAFLEKKSYSIPRQSNELFLVVWSPSLYYVLITSKRCWYLV